jgi:hypothetical protein
MLKICPDLHFYAGHDRCTASQKSWGSPNTAGEMGGGLDGNPGQSNIFFIASGGLIAHTILIPPPQHSHLKTSNSQTRFINSAQL